MSKPQRMSHRPLRFITPAALSVSLILAAGCGSGGQGPTGSGGSTTGGANGSGGASTGSGGSSAGTGGAGTGGNSGSGGMTSGSGGRANTGGTSGTGTGGRDSSGGATNTGGAAGGGTGTGGRAGGASGTGGANAGGTSGGTFTVTASWTSMAGCSANMKTACGNLPTEITRSGAGTSPELHWTGAPADTKSFAVVLQDLSGNSTHWVIWNIPGTATGLPANVSQTSAMPATPTGSQQCGKGTDAATKFGYIGPGAPCNVYEFRVYALNVAPFAPTAASCATTTDAAAIRTQLNGLNASMLLGSAALLGKTNTSCN